MKGISPVERLTAKTIKKIVYGLALSDGHIEPRGRFQLYSKHLEYVEYTAKVLNQITGVEAKVSVKNDKRGYIGYVCNTKTHTYFKNIRKHVYETRKQLTPYNVSRLDELSLAMIYMSDGYTEHAKNRKTNKIQNIGWLCLEAFPKEELEILQKHLKEKWDIGSSLIKKPWGFGYRMRVGGENLQRLISTIYPHILPCFSYKTELFYKKRSTALELSNAEQYIHTYECVEDIVRHSQK